MNRKGGVRWLVVLIVMACLLLMIVFRKPLLTAVGESLIVSDPLERADAIYVLAGDFFGSRVLLGADLGARGFAPLVLLSGGRYSNEYYGNRYSGDLALQFAVEHGYQPALFQAIRLDTPSTIEEARAMGPIFQRMGVRRVILVTSNFHSRRAALVFRLVLPDVHFSVVPSSDLDYNPTSWWQTRRGRHLVESEYEKIAGTLIVRTGLAGE
jgi:uncharacterized SAM-binding protein YcdF (DUF218 family)